MSKLKAHEFLPYGRQAIDEDDVELLPMSREILIRCYLKVDHFFPTFCRFWIDAHLSFATNSPECIAIVDPNFEI